MPEPTNCFAYANAQQGQLQCAEAGGVNPAIAQTPGRGRYPRIVRLLTPAGQLHRAALAQQ
jgi:hypothetical protein